ncbi:MAG: SDR family oxidoreductase [Spongiibacteraceae bacterium]
MSVKAGDLFNLEGKVAVITGGSRGIGKMIASVFVANGVRVYITGRNAEVAAETARELSQQGGDCRALPADLSRMDEVERVAAELAQRETALHILVNNAGTTWGAPIDQFPETGWDRVMNLNIKGLFFLTQKLLPLLSAGASDDDWSRVINVSSVGARIAEDGLSAPSYASSKAAVEQLTRVFARQLGPNRVTSNCIAPGWFPTRMNAPITDTMGAAWLAATPSHRFGTAADIGGLAMFLASKAGSYVNGQIITIDGGKTL